MADWYYIGHYGQLGPLTREQIDDLVLGGVIVRETYVWHTGLGDWLSAERVPELKDAFVQADPYAAPPPTPAMHRPQPPVATGMSGAPAPSYAPATTMGSDVYFSAPVSDKSPTLGGILNIFLPGVGRMYLGYLAYGLLQLLLAFCLVGVLWSVVDGFVILGGGLRLDGYGRRFVNH